MAGDFKAKYPAASTAVTVTNLHSLASSQTLVAGWTGNSVANTTNVDFDWSVGGTFTTHASNRQAGTIEVWVIGALNDTPTWPTTATGTIGTEGAASFTAREQLASCGRLLVAFAVTSTASQVYAFPQTSVSQLFSVPPTHWALFATQNCTTTTTAGLASSGSALYYTRNIAQYT